MRGTTLRTIRMPVSIVEAAQTKADAMGITFNDLVVHALCRLLGLSRCDPVPFLSSLSDWVLSEFSPDCFPEDVTLKVFRHIRQAPELFARYRALIDDSDGRRDERAKGGLHRRIGKVVKNVLRARVVGRSAPLNPEEDLIKSHALLRPSVLVEGR